MKPGSKAVNSSEIQRQEVEKQCPLGFSGDTQHLPTNGGINAPKHVLQVGGFPTVSNAVIDDFAVYLVGSNIDERHEYDIPNRGRAGRWYPPPRSGIGY